MTTTAKIEPWIECAVWEIDSRCLETGAFFNRNQAANIIAAHAPKASLSAIFECIGGEDNIGVILPEQLKRLTLNVIMPFLLEPGRLGELALILNRLVLTAEAHAPKQEAGVPDGWKLVPLSPTKEMIDAIHNGWKDAQPDGEYDGEKTTSMYAMHVAAYKAGVKAAPEQLQRLRDLEQEKQP